MAEYAEELWELMQAPSDALQAFSSRLESGRFLPKTSVKVGDDYMML